MNHLGSVRQLKTSVAIQKNNTDWIILQRVISMWKTRWKQWKTRVKKGKTCEFGKILRFSTI